MDKITRDLVAQLRNLIDIQNKLEIWAKNDTMDEEEFFALRTFIDKEIHCLIKDIIHIEKL